MSTQSFTLATPLGELLTKWDNDGIEGEFLDGKPVKMVIAVGGQTILRSCSDINRATSSNPSLGYNLEREGLGRYVTAWGQQMLKSFDAWEHEKFSRKGGKK